MNKDELLARLRGIEWNDFKYKRAQRGVQEALRLRLAQVTEQVGAKPLNKPLNKSGPSGDQVGTRLGLSAEQRYYLTREGMAQLEEYAR